MKSGGFLEVWITDLEAMGPVPRTLLNLLEEGEEERAKTMRLGKDRKRYLVGRILLRLALSHLAGGDPRAWRFITGKTGKVKLAHLPGTALIDFNISHSENAVAVALSSSGQVGVDVEIEKKAVTEGNVIDATPLIAFSKREREFLSTQPQEKRWKEMLRLWTIKEAYAKLIGAGIEQEFSEIDVSDEALGPKIGTVCLESYELKLRSENYHLALAARPHAGRVPPAAIRIVDPLRLAQ